MSWIFEGSCANISLSLSETGHWSVHGTASQDCRPVTDDFEIIRHVRGLPGYWGIHSIEDAEHRYDGIGYGMKRFFAANEGRSAAMIQYFHATKDGKAAIGLKVVMPPELAAQIVATFRMVLANPSVNYVIAPEFDGITEHQTGHSPIIGDFLHPEIMRSKAYFSREVSISFRTSSN